MTDPKTNPMTDHKTNPLTDQFHHRQIVIPGQFFTPAMFFLLQNKVSCVLKWSMEPIEPTALIGHNTILSTHNVWKESQEDCMLSLLAPKELYT